MCCFLLDLKERMSVLVFVREEGEDIVKTGRGGAEEECTSGEEDPVLGLNDEVRTVVEGRYGREGGGGVFDLVYSVSLGAWGVTEGEGSSRRSTRPELTLSLLPFRLPSRHHSRE